MGWTLAANMGVPVPFRNRVPAIEEALHGLRGPQNFANFDSGAHF
jgi:hypothetical protein